MTTVERRVASFDIFDTVLTRRVANPRAAFLLLGRRLCSLDEIDCSAHAFATARTAAEVRAFKNGGGLDSSVTLRDIYSELASSLHWSIKRADCIYGHELALEAELLVPLTSGRRAVDQARANGLRIAFISDMYLPKEYLEDLLAVNGLFEHGDSLLVSNDLKASKASGKLWPHALNKLGVSPSQIHHIGNDSRSDGRSAQQAGISSELVEENNPNRYEEALESYSTATDGLSSALAGASRLARLAAVDPSRSAVSDVAAGVVAPFVIGNLLWTLGVAKKEGLKQLFFVSRDGQILCDVAKVLAPRIGYTGELTYMYGSRQAWSLASISPGNCSHLTAAIPDSGDVTATLRQLLARLELTPEEIALPLAYAGFHRATWGRQLGPGEPERLRDFIAEDLDVSILIAEKSKGCRDRVLGYLDQVGAITNEPIGFVDLGTGATLFNSLGSILASVGQVPPMGFYFGLRKKVPDVGFGKPLAYVRDEDEDIGFIKTPGLLTMVELACTADHGSVIGYEEVDGEVVPKFDENGNDPVVEWGLPLVRETVRRVAEELVLQPDLVGVQGIDLRPAILDAFNLFWSSPTKEEALAWGAYPFEDGWGRQSFRHPIAETRGVVDALRRQPYRHWWEQGASQLSGPVTRSAFESRRVAREVAGKVRNRLR